METITAPYNETDKYTTVNVEDGKPKLERNYHYRRSYRDGIIDSPISKSKWLELREVQTRDYAYHYASAIGTTDARAVSILPFIQEEDGTKRYLLRKEICPCWSPVELYGTTITGGVEKDETLEQAAVRELREEAGYTIEEDRLIHLSQTFCSKTSNVIKSLYAVELNKVDIDAQIIPETDGTFLEKMAENYWTTEIDSDDLTAYKMFYLLNKHQILEKI